MGCQDSGSQLGLSLLKDVRLRRAPHPVVAHPLKNPLELVRVAIVGQGVKRQVRWNEALSTRETRMLRV